MFIQAKNKSEMKSDFIVRGVAAALAVMVLAQCKGEEPVSGEEKQRMEKNKKAPEGMVFIPGGEYKRGNDKAPGNGRNYKEEMPVHKVTVDAFYMDETEVTNRQFEAFVKATGYKTFAERGPNAKDFPKAPPEALKAGSNVFVPPAQVVDPNRVSPWTWWKFTPAATWRHPHGPGSSIKDKMDHPVGCGNFEDAQA